VKRLKEADQRLVSRFVDGDLGAQAKLAFERRLLQEQTLRESVAEQRAVRDWFGRSESGGDREVVSSCDIADRVLAEARRLPSREALAGEAGVLGELELGERAVLLTARWMMLAAAVVLGVSLLFAAELLHASDSRHLDASDTKRIERIDREIEAVAQSREVEPRRR